MSDCTGFNRQRRQREAEEKAKREAEEKNKREVEEKARLDLEKKDKDAKKTNKTATK